jgi:hypothetical protein
MTFDEALKGYLRGDKLVRDYLAPFFPVAPESFHRPRVGVRFFQAGEVAYTITYIGAEHFYAAEVRQRVYAVDPSAPPTAITVSGVLSETLVRALFGENEASIRSAIQALRIVHDALVIDETPGFGGIDELEGLTDAMREAWDEFTPVYH